MKVGRRSAVARSHWSPFAGWPRVKGDAASAGLLLAATLIALVWANSPWWSSYQAVWSTELTVGLADAELSLDLRHWVNDGLMVFFFFFFVVGLEVKRELTVGELTDRRRAAVPARAVLGGLVLPALLYLALNPSGEAARAWGVVISTDTAFALGLLALAGPSCPAQVRVFLLTLAIADDVGALAVIAVVYTADLTPGWLALGVTGIAVMVAMHRWVWRGPPYFVVAVGVWLATQASGVHPTLAGVAMALFVAAPAPRAADVRQAVLLTRAFSQSPGAELGRAARLGIDRAVPSLDRLQRLYQPWTNVVVLPVFALANAGVSVRGDALHAAVTSSVAWGAFLGLALGKPVAVLLGALAAVRLRMGSLAPELDTFRLGGAAALSGVGFTISLFIVDLALDDPGLADQARLGVLAGSATAAVAGMLLIRTGPLVGRNRSSAEPDPGRRSTGT